MVKSQTTSRNKLADPAQSSVAHPDSSADALRAQFTSAAIGMSWQLALIVLVPIIGGYKLDQSSGRTPLFTLLGLAIALIGSIVIIKRAVAVFGNVTPKSSDTHKDKA